MIRNRVPALAGNYTVADRPNDTALHYIVIHATELSYPETVTRFQTAHQVSAHAVLRGSDGLVTEMVAPKNIAWHAGNWDMNVRSLGIEQEAFEHDASSFTIPMLRALAELILTWSRKYAIPLDRAHIIGHDNVPGRIPADQLAMHRDPGTLFDWQRLFDLLGIATPRIREPQVGVAVEVVANVASVYVSPTTDSALIAPTDQPAWQHQVSFGQRFVCAAQQDGWTAIWYGGQIGWVKNPANQVLTQVSTDIWQTDAETTEIYGTTQPEAEPLATVAAGEQYVIGQRLAGLQTSEVAGRFQVQPTATQFNQIWFNHRLAYVRA